VSDPEVTCRPLGAVSTTTSPPGFWFEDGLIKRQEDTFDLWKWASMALGPRALLGWLPPVQNAIRKQAQRSLADYIKSNPGT
jgi:hypothetical protein